eukprot:c13154_g1_i2 orf=442-1935(+)
MGRACSSYLFFSIEESLSNIARGILYCFALAYCFLGLSAITARFFLGMENIVQQTREVSTYELGSGRRIVKRERVWNYTVADITLLAFGTSFPQISLATIDACMNLGNLYAGGVGPGTLVGSAACDLYLIHAACIIIPKRGSIKKVLDLGVWAVELAWSLWAYVWLYIILLVWTPQVITIWEAGLTVLQFFILILHAYAQDKGWPFISISFLDQRKRESWIASDASHCSEVLNGQESSQPTRQQEHDTFALLIDPNIPAAARTEEEHAWIYTKLLWQQQFYDILTPRGGLRGSNGKPLQGMQFCYACLAFPWRFAFAFVPPHSLFHGWATFLCSLVFITGISYVVRLLTDLIGCVTGISPYVIAITVLATGTSWPDLAASMIAAYRQPTADSAIANITCSNSVNIFIGIGVPWVINTTYNRAVLKSELRVPSLQLGFILIVFFITFVLCMVVVTARRYFLGGELGGPRKWAWASSGFILFLWAIFLVLACLRVYRII